MEENASAVRESLKKALTDPDDYDVLVGRGNTIGAVRDRVALAGDILRAR